MVDEGAGDNKLRPVIVPFELLRRIIVPMAFHVQVATEVLFFYLAAITLTISAVEVDRAEFNLNAGRVDDATIDLDIIGRPLLLLIMQLRALHQLFFLLLEP